MVLVIDFNVYARKICARYDTYFDDIWSFGAAAHTYLDECITSVSVRARNSIDKLRVTTPTYGSQSSSRAMLFAFVGDGNGLRTRTVSESIILLFAI